MAVLRNACVLFGPNGIYDMDFKKVWKMDVPIKNKVFSWRLFLNEIHKRQALSKRGIPINSNNACVYCGVYEE